MDDERKKGPRKGGPKSPGGARGGERPARSGKPAFAGKPRTGGPGKPAFAGKPRAEGASKPFQKRRDDAGEARARPEGAERPFRAGPKRDGKPFEKRAPRDGDAAGGERKPFVRSSAGDRPFRAGPKRDGKPFEKRAPRDGEAAGGERKPFVRSERPTGDRPFRAGPKRDGKPFEKRAPRDGDAAGGERKPFVRSERPTGDRPFRAGPKRDGAPFEKRPPRDRDATGGERKPFVRKAEIADTSEGERIAKRLARAGIASRRDAEELIAAGRVRVNGKVLSSPAVNVTANDTIELDGTTIPPIERTRLFLFHKPAGVVTTNRDPEGRKTVFDVLPKDLPRLMTIGRLDINTEGLLLLTNDGGLARMLELPTTGWLRRYRVRVHGKPDEKALAELKNGIAVDGVFYGAIEATLDRAQGTNAWLTIGLREGKNREVKTILGALGLDVTRLIRISYGPFQLAELPEGHVWEMNGRTLRDQLGERLIEESGANFDADIVKPFSNKPTQREFEPEEQPERPKIVRDGERGPIGEGGLIKNRKRRENTRDEALGKLSTRPQKSSFGERGPKPERGSFGERSARPSFGDKKPDRGPRPPKGGKGEREQRPIEPPGQRKANVWMAPGARPIGKGRAEAEKHDAEARKDRKPRFDKPGGKPGFDKPRGERPGGGDRPRGDGPKGPRGGGRNADRRR